MGDDRHPSNTLDDIRDADTEGLGAPRHDEEPKNVWGEPMEKCSGKGMAMTGAVDTGYCVHDAASDNFDVVCIDIAKAKKPGLLYGGYDFCEVIGETDPNWCDEYLPCQHDPHMECEVEHWCVDSESLADFIHIAGGCDKIGELICDATNELVLARYVFDVATGDDTDRRAEIALACIKQRCGQDVH